MNKIDFSEVQKCLKCAVNDSSYVENIKEKMLSEAKAVCSAATFSQADVEVHVVKDAKGISEIFVRVSVFVTEKTYDFPLTQFLKMPPAIKNTINSCCIFEENDFTTLCNKAKLLVSAHPNIEVVEQLPTLNGDIDVLGDACYNSLCEDLLHHDEVVSADKKAFAENNKEFAGLYLKDFRESGKNVVLFSSESLIRILDIDQQKFVDVMKYWYAKGYIVISDAKSMQGRLQVKCRLGVENKMWYAVVTLADFKL